MSENSNGYENKTIRNVSRDILFNAQVIKQTVSSVTIEWDTIPDADVYKIEQHNKKLGWVRVCWLSSPSVCIQHLDDNFAYRFRIKAMKFSEIKKEYLDFAMSSEIVGVTFAALPSTMCLFRAIKKGQQFIVKRIIRRRNSLIEYPASNGYLPLANAITFGEICIIDILLSAGANVHTGNLFNGRSPLHIAFYHGYLPVARMLLNKRADINAKDINGLTPCHYAVDGSQCEILKFALENGADIEAADNSGFTLLLRAVIIKSDIAIIKLLIVQGANTKMTNINGLSCTKLGIIFGNNEVMNYLDNCRKLSNFKLIK